MERNRRAPVFCMTVDMDEWYQIRWVTGMKGSLWPDTRALFRDYYKSDRPAGELHAGVDKLLRLFAAEGVKATFFTLGETAQYYPEALRRIAAAGHEVACHSYFHTDLFRLTDAEFERDLQRAKALLESVTGQTVKGFRAPSLTLERRHAAVLQRVGLRYDSSLSNLRPMFGKYRGFHGTPQTPYVMAPEDLRRAGAGGLVELPIPSMPVAHIPGSIVIVHRIFGTWYCKLAIAAALRRGYGMYYCHPYDLNPAPTLGPLRWKHRTFLRHLGPWYERELGQLLRWVKTRGATFVRGGDLAETVRARA
ncbi:MAG: polysaccharide deacetylase family protein [Lentisphaerae bacterium]|nr:polysaccharide deacetylase family protein [Lentisphaerota bacterium]